MDKKIMVVEDSLFIANAVKKILEDENQDVKVILSAKNALQELKKQSYDLIILDLMMPDMSGEAMFEILKNDNKTKNIPVIILTAKTDALEKSEGLRQAQGFIPKPFDKQDLKDKVEQCLKMAAAKKKIKGLKKKSKE